MNEVWKDIPNYPNFQVSNRGRVKRLACRGVDGRKLKEHIVPIYHTKSKDGRCIYATVSLYNVELSKTCKNISVGHLVLLVFVGPPQFGQECRHLDDIPTNCVLENLAWGTRTENRLDAVRNGRWIGEKNGMAKLTEIQVKEIISLYKRGWNKYALADKYDTTHSAVYDILSYRTWRYLPK